MNDRSTALIRDWYLGPCDLNHFRTSASTRSEMGSLATGSTTVAEAQKSSGRFLSSRGEVRAISASGTRRRRRRSARPFRGLLVDGLREGLTLTAVTHSGRNNAPFLSTRFGSISVDDGQRDAVGDSDGDHALFTVVTAVVYAFQRGIFEDLRREIKIEAAVPQIPIALASVPGKSHDRSIRLYIRMGKLQSNEPDYWSQSQSAR